MRLSTAILTLALALPAQADLLMPGTKGVFHTFEIQGLAAVPEGTTLFVYPTQFWGSTEVREGVPFTFYKFCSPRLYATTGPIPTTPDGDLQPLLKGLPASEITFNRVSALPEWSATESIKTIYRFAGIEDGVIRLELVSTIHLDAQGAPASAGGSIIGLGAHGSWILLPALGALVLAARVTRRRRGAVSA